MSECFVICISTKNQPCELEKLLILSPYLPQLSAKQVLFFLDTLKWLAIMFLIYKLSVIISFCPSIIFRIKNLISIFNSADST